MEEIVKTPPLEDINAWADFWYYQVGVNPIPADTKNKRTFIKWSQWQINPIPEEQFNEWKEMGAFAQGMAIIVGKVWRGANKDKYLVFVDLDNLKAIEEVTTRNGQSPALKQISEKWIVEQHLDDTNKAHVFFYSEVPFHKKSSDAAKDPLTPAIEVKGRGSHGIAYCTPSYHKNGHRYQILDTPIPETLNELQAGQMMEHIDTICKKYGLQYLGNGSSSSGKAKIPMEELADDEFSIVEGRNRHEALLRYMDSKIKYALKYKKITLSEAKDLSYIKNQKACKPPLDDKEIEKLWNQAYEFIVNEAGEEEEKEGEEGEEDTKTKKQQETTKAKIALQLAIANSKELFLNEFGRAFAAMSVNNHVEVHPMDERRFKNWISGIYYKENDDLLADDDLKKIVRILTAKAEFDSGVSRRNVDLRVRGYNKRYEESLFQNGGNGHDVGNVGYAGKISEITEDFDAIYYDLTNPKWEAIKITPEGWELDRNPPTLFRRFGGELPQPYPVREYEPTVLDEFLDLLNLKPDRKEDQKKILKPDIVTKFYPNTIPKPILILPAAQGSAKTTAFELMRDLVDPNSTLTTSLPREDVNLKQSLAHNYISFFDNVSDLKDWQSDVLCRGVTGAGDMKRKLFENDEDIIYKYKRIIGLNGITNVITKADLLDRGLYVEFGEIAREDRKLLRIIWRKYLELKPKLLAFCFDVISEVMAERQRWKGIDDDYFGMKDLIEQKGGLPRMADWAILAEQVSAIIAKKEGKPYKPGDFLEAFDKNLEILNTEALKASLVAEALIAFMTDKEVRGLGRDKERYGNDLPHWEGSATHLLGDLNEFILSNPDLKIDIKSRSWVPDPARLGREIAQIASNLRALGIAIDAHRTTENVIYTIAKLPTLPTLPTYNSKDGGNNENGGNNGEKHVGNVGHVSKNDILKRDDLLVVASKLSDSKGFFTLREWQTECMFKPVQDPCHMEENQAAQTLYQLVAEGMIEEFEPGKYKPTEKLSIDGDD